MTTATVGAAVTAVGAAAGTLTEQLGTMAIVAIPVGFIAFGLIYLVRRGKSLMK